MDDQAHSKSVDEFKVNSFMRKHGFQWKVKNGVPFDGNWKKGSRVFNQKSAIFLYETFAPKKKWWHL